MFQLGLTATTVIGFSDTNMKFNNNTMFNFSKSGGQTGHFGSY